MSKKITNHGDLEVYQRAFELSMRLFDLSKSFPREETYSLTDQMRRSSRSVCANLAEAWRKRRYEKSFISKLSDSEGEVAETQVWIAFAYRCGYMNRDEAKDMYHMYNEVLRTLVGMINHPETWIITDKDKMLHENQKITESRSHRASCHRVILPSCHPVIGVERDLSTNRFSARAARVAADRAGAAGAWLGRAGALGQHAGCATRAQ